MKARTAQHGVSRYRASGQTGHGLLLAALLLAAGCTGSPFRPAIPPFTPAQAAVTDSGIGLSTQDAVLLTAIDGMQDSQRKDFNGRILETGNTFTTASGCECRYVRQLDGSGLPSGPEHLACRDGEHRFIAVDVFSATPGTRRKP